MRAMKVEMVLEKGKDDMEEILVELKTKYNPKQLGFYEVEYFEK